MAYNIREEGDYSVVELTGDVDLSASPEARKTLLECLNNQRDLLVDRLLVTLRSGPLANCSTGLSASVGCPPFRLLRTVS